MTLRNGGHFEILRGHRDFLFSYLVIYFHAKFGAFMTFCKIIALNDSYFPHYKII